MNCYEGILHTLALNKKCLAILIDPEKFHVESARPFINKLPKETTHIFIGGSTVFENQTETVVASIKDVTKLPVLLFPGDHSQITKGADALLFLSLLSGRNAEYLIGQHVKSISKILELDIETIPTGYLLIDGNHESAVAKVTQTMPMPQDNVEAIVHTAIAGKLNGAKLIYLEAGSGAKTPVNVDIIKAVKEKINIPLIIGGGIKTELQKQEAYKAGADMVVMGTVFEV